MPRSAAQSEAQTLQGSLFGAPESAETSKRRSVPSAATELDDLTDASLSADAAARPRQRQERDAFTNAGNEQDADGSDPDDNGDEPAWAHHNQVDLAQLTPMLRHYVELKIEHPERVLLYRLGDFFECFFEDAVELSRVLELTLTGKEGGKAIGRVPMAGIPHHAAERYCSELIRRGLSVALCDQLEAAPASGSAKGTLLKRDITRVLTPGTVLEEGLLSARRNNWLAAVVVEPAQGRQPFRWGLACADVSTGEFLVREQDNSAALHQELARLDPAELIHHSQNSNAPSWCPERLHRYDISNTAFSQPEAEALLLERFRLQTLDGLGLHNVPLALRAAGGLLAYLGETCPLDDDGITPPPLERPITCFPGDALVLDAQTRRNLELTSTQRDNQFQGSLLWAIDRTLTAMGARCLRRWIEAPLMDPDLIRTRQASVSQLVSKRPLRQALRRLLRPMGDLERLAGRAGAGHAGARDLVAIADGLERLPQLANLITSQLKGGPSWLSDVLEPDPTLAALGGSIRLQLVDNPPLSLSEGGLIHDGVDPLLDGLRNQLDDQEQWLAEQEQLERQRSNNSNLKLQYHRTFGYFLSVSRARSGAVPDHWIRRQTLANEERFITPDLKAREGQIFQMRARAAQREYELFCRLREQVGAMAVPIRQAARAVAGLDALKTHIDNIHLRCSLCNLQFSVLEVATAHKKVHEDNTEAFKTAAELCTTVLNENSDTSSCENLLQEDTDLLGPALDLD